jgi:hypothetical protein
MKHEGSCHCGRIAFELEGEVGRVIECNCSLCRRRGALLSFHPREALTLLTPEADMGTYTFNTHRIRHHFCPTCGISPFGEAVDPRTNAPTVAVNVRCLPDVDLDALEVKRFDGASL